ncbi:hypothetical protein A1O3_09491 [Capronia epimyces CBS 606.96]|uniref:Uncharacterized protein n=1 Tax=Capronia epimyces CBS 606.96 TaxID=1182542 RepID=W9XLZ2_9EURO|nr:uncharacterized protein A1O3_09491 [Capronia epimyces CBS 606.96]EXJ78330.1 hypothetical protein A1O3_09491 [Capronia epimyces CBS 606.96]
MDPEEIQTEDNAHTGCYIFKPAGHDDAEPVDRPRKRRKTTKSQSQSQYNGGDGDGDGDHTWPALLGGQEAEAAMRLRKQQFRSQWETHQAMIDEAVNEVDDTFVDDVLHYVRQEQASSPGRLKAGLLVSVPGHNAQRDLVQGWKSRRANEGDTKEVLVALSPTHAPNMQTALKNVIRMAICQDGGWEEYTEFLAQHKAMIPMNFDLELLQKYVQKHGIQRVLVSVPDIETFDTAILAELISMLGSWSARIPLVLLIGISTTVELFESRLSRSTVSLLEAEVFEPCQSPKQHDPLTAIYEAVQYSDTTQMFLGPAVLAILAELAEDQSTTTETFARTMQYVFMSHFFANPLSALSSPSESKISDQPTVCRAIRNTNGFKRYCEALAKGDAAQRQKARALLVSDETLEEEALEAIRAGQQRLRSSLAAIRTLRRLSRYLPKSHGRGRPSLDIETELLAALPDLTQTEHFEAVELAIQEMDFVRFRAFFNEAASTLEDVKLFEASQPRTATATATAEIRTYTDIEEAINAVDTTMEDDSATALTEAFSGLLRRYLHGKTSLPSPDTAPLQAVTNPFHDFMSEAFTYTLKSPLNAIVHPRARYSLERALTRPADYLGCECCMSSSRTGEVADRATLPATSLLLSMLNEAGHVVNVRDLWDAFRDTIAPALAGSSGRKVDSVLQARDGTEVSLSPRLEQRRPDNEPREADEDEDGDGDGDGADMPSEAMERQALALFYRALADLRHLGFVKPSKRKPGVDCIAKTAWMGL